MDFRKYFFRTSGSGKTSLDQSILWGLPLLGSTLLIGFFVPSLPAKLFLLLAVIGVSFVAYFKLYGATKKKAEQISPLVPAIVTYVALYFALIPYFSPIGVAGFLFGTALIGVNIIFDRHTKKREFLQQLSSWIGSILIILSILWIGAVQLGLNDNMARSWNKFQSWLDDELEFTTETKETVSANDTEIREPKAEVATANFPTAGPGTWFLEWKDHKGAKQRYRVDVHENSNTHKNFSAAWESQGEDGVTEIYMKKSGGVTVYKGWVNVSAAGKIPSSQGTVTLEKESKDCFIGEAVMEGGARYEVSYFEKRKEASCGS